MDLKHKHWALIIIGVLVAALVVIAAYYMLGSQKVNAPTSPTATSTAQTATTTAPAPAAHITEHGTYYDIDMAYPSATPLLSVSTDANMAAVTAMKAAMQSAADQFVKDGNFANLSPDEIQMMQSTGQKESLDAEYKTYTGSRTVSYVFAISEDTLGAHPNTVYQTFTFDTQTGTQLGLSDIFANENYLSELSTIAQQKLPAILAEHENVDVSQVDTDYMSQGSAPSSNNYQDWYVSGNNLVIVFPPYQVGPYALGTIEMPVPVSSISAFLKPEYR